METNQSQQITDINELLNICATPHCRPILSYFRDSSSESAVLSEIVDEVTKQAHGGREQVAMQVHHSALPRLAEIGYLEYDKINNSVQYHGHSELETVAVAIATR